MEILLIFFAVVITALVIIVLTTLRKADKKYDQLYAEHRKLEAKAKPLWKYQPIKNIEAEVSKRQDQGVRILRDAQAKSDQIKSQAELILNDNKTKGQQIITNAETEKEVIIKNANIRAEEIAGEALEAKRKADKFESIVTAMKNTIKGYGDEYLQPSHSLIDDLAEEFGHKEAGVELKKVRELVRRMVKESRAGKCDYKDIYRAKSAVDFVVDAFNGKVDSILTRAKHDNYGKLTQEIRDAFSLVAHNGTAFREARITHEYLEARIQELQWATRVHLLRVEEREEQRRIREAMREEEKARREYEKARKEAEKEEHLIQDALKQAQEQFAAASEEEREKFQDQLRALEEKLATAEEKNQRAMSLAQQTRRGHVYIISNIGSFGEQIYKIGLTRRLEPLDRIKELGDASVPFSFDIHAIISSEDAPALENALHHSFHDHRVNKVNMRKEFFNVPLVEIRKLTEQEGIEAKWTMKAEATEYRESRGLAKLEEQVSVN